MSKWKVGETYKTRGGEDAFYVGDVGMRRKDGGSHLFVIDGKKAVWILPSGRWLSDREDGIDIMPRKRTVWLRQINNHEYRRYYREEDAKEAVDLMGGGPVYPLEIEE